MVAPREQTIGNPIAKAWFEKANSFLSGQQKDKKTLHRLVLNSHEFDCWLTYFIALGWVPVFMRQLLAEDIPAATVPAQYPELFDLSYAPSGPIRQRLRLPKSPVPALPPPRESGTDYFSMFAKYGRPIGRFEKGPPLNEQRPDGKGPPSLGEVIARAKLWTRPTDDALRAHYGTRKDE